jgi:hypothetical protein
MNFSSYDDNIHKTLKDDLAKIKDEFVKEDVSNINIYFLYSVNNVCEQYKKIVVNVVDGRFTKDELYSEIIKNRNEAGRRYNVNGVYSYNFNVDELFEFIETDQDDHCFKEYKQIENVDFKPSFNYFQHHNSLFVFFTNEKGKSTRRSGQSSKKKTAKNV